MRTLGIDLGTWSVKAVELETTFGRFEIHDYHEERVRAGETSAQAAGRLVRALPRPPDTIVACLPQGKVTFRNLQLPTRDKKKIQAAVAFELEDELPFQPEDAVFDYSILSQASDGTHVHIASTLKKHVSELLDALKGESIDPDVVTTESWGLRTLCSRIIDKAAQEQPVMIALLGDSSSTLHIQWKGFPVLSRRIAWGGRHLTDALVQKYGISRDEAERAKIQSGFVLASEPKGRSTQEQIEFGDVFLEAMRPLLTEIRQTTLTSRSFTQAELRGIYVTGGTSLLPGLRAVVEENTQVPVYPLQALSAVSPSGVSYSDETDAFFPLAAALALTTVGQERGKTCNLRRGELAKEGAGDAIDFKTLQKPLLAAATVAASLYLSLAVQSAVYDRRMQDVDTQMEHALKGFFGPLGSSTLKLYVGSPDRLKKAVKNELEKEREIAGLFSQNPHSPLDFLNTLSSTIHKDVVVDMISFRVGAAPGTPYDRVATEEGSLSFIVDSKASEESLERVLGGILSGLKKVESAPAPDQGDGKQRFRVSFTGTPMESAYGH